MGLGWRSPAGPSWPVSLVPALALSVGHYRLAAASPSLGSEAVGVARVMVMVIVMMVGESEVKQWVW